MERQDLERMNREQLIAQAEALGIPRPRVLTQPELIDEIIARTTKNERERAKARGWLGRARDLLARVVEKGLHLPETVRAARALHSGGEPWPAPPPPLPTVTLAEIYAAQGHFDRAIAVLDEVIAREPDHREAKALRARFVEQAERSRSRSDRAAAAEAHEADRHASHGPKAHHGKVKITETRPPADPPLPPADPSPPSEAAAPPTEVSAPEVHAAVTDAPPAPVDAAVELPIPSPAPVQVSPPAPAAVESEEAVAPTVNAVALAARTANVTVAAAPVEEAPAVAAAPVEEAPAVVAPPPVEEAPVAAERAVAAPPPVEEEPVGAETPPAEEMPVVEGLAAALEEPPLPQRYEVDEVVAIAVDPRTVYVYWEVRATTLAHARAAHPGGSLCLRIASVTASWEGPRAETRDLHIDSLYGDRFVRDIRPGSLIRVSVGWKSEAGFEPLAVGDELSAPRMLPVDAITHDVVRWEPTPVAPFQSPRVEAAEAPRVDPSLHEPGPAPAFQAFLHAAESQMAVFHEGDVDATAAAHAWGLEERVAAARVEGEGRGGPVDTGVASWRSAVLVGGTPPPPEEIGEEVVDTWWADPGGASELARGLRRVRRPRRRGPGAPGVPPFAPFAPPGASELARGGASDLARRG